MNAGRAVLVAAIVVGILIAASSAPVARAGTVSTASISDPSIDVKKQDPAWLDIVSASVTGGGPGNFSFSLTVAAPVPSATALGANSSGIVEWWFCLQVASAFTVGGWPGPNGTSATTSDPCQYFLVLVWPGSTFVGTLDNRTPLLTGAAPSVALFPVSLQSATVTWSVAPGAIGSPTSLGFLVGTETEQKADFQIVDSTTVVVYHGNNAIHIADLDGGPNGSFASWP